MNDLIRSEWRRFRRLVLTVTIVHGLALLLMSRTANLLQLAFWDHTVFLAVYMLLGLVLGAAQVGSYRPSSKWVWLIHRPLAPARIFTALAVSALVMLGIAVVAPLVIFLVATDVITTQVVDVRHYVALFHLLSFTMMAWLAGAHACTSRSWAAIAVLLAPILLALNLASVWWLFIPVLTCLVWLGFVALHSFRADRDAPIARSGVLLLTALPLQLGFFFLVFQLGKTGIGLVELFSRSPGRTVLDGDPAVDVDAELRNIGQTFITKGLARSSDPRAATWRAQLPLAKMADVQPDAPRFPVRHQFSNFTRPWWDNKRNIEWTFSHDRMQFHGRNPNSGVSRGWWGRRDWWLRKATQVLRWDSALRISQPGA